MRGFLRVGSRLIAITILLTGLAVHTVIAQDTGSVDITATIGVVPELTLSLCDTSAVFGTGLTNHGAAPTGADPGVTASTEGTEIGQGVFYSWTPECGPDLSASSNVDFQLSFCATENDAVGGSPDVTLASQDLRLELDTVPTAVTYADWLLRHALRLCGDPGFTGVSSPGSFNSTFALGLRVDDGDADGHFHSVLTFTLVPS